MCCVVEGNSSYVVEQLLYLVFCICHVQCDMQQGFSRQQHSCMWYSLSCASAACQDGQSEQSHTHCPAFLVCMQVPVTEQVLCTLEHISLLMGRGLVH